MNNYFIVLVPNYWGGGHTLEEAIANCRKAKGSSLGLKAPKEYAGNEESIFDYSKALYYRFTSDLEFADQGWKAFPDDAPSRGPEGKPAEEPDKAGVFVDTYGGVNWIRCENVTKAPLFKQ